VGLRPRSALRAAGRRGHVVFPCGTTLGPDGDTLRVYYGAADTSIAVATASLARLLGWLDDNSTPDVADTDSAGAV